jgi:large subunit ribosomal protein L23
MLDIIKKPIVTEKAMKHTESGQYVFEVGVKANKIQIKKALEEMFEVKIMSIRTSRIKSKIKSRITKKGLMRGKTPQRKKAYITLQKGQTIDIVSGAASS